MFAQRYAKTLILTTTVVLTAAAGKAGAFLDCNGNGVDDTEDITTGFSADANTNGIPDECDFRVCDNVWDGFPENTAPDPFQFNQWLGEVDYNGDGFYWDNPEDTALICLFGCNADPPDPFDLAVEVSVHPAMAPEDGYVASEYFRTLDRELECYAAVYSLSFSPRVLGTFGDTEFNHKYDWQLFLYDGSVREVNAWTYPIDPEEGAVILIEYTSAASLRVPADQRGKILVKNPAGTPAYLDTGVALLFELDPVSFLTGTPCLDIEAVLDNRDDSVKLYIGGELKVETTRLDSSALGMHYFHLQAVVNGAATSPNTRFRLDKFRYCLTGPALMDWPDCNGNCVDDEWELSSGLGSDCNSNGILDECDGEQNCSCEGPPVSGECILCNHDHRWDFEPSEGFVVGGVDRQQGWALGPTTDQDGGQIVASGPPFEGEPGFSGQALMLSPKPGGSFVDPQGIRGPRTRDEQPDSSDATDDPDIEYWEFDAVLDDTDEDGEVFGIVWDECGDWFIHDDSGGPPSCWTDDPPGCFLIEELGANLSRYGYFNAGVRFRTDWQGNTELRLLSDNGWNDIGDNRSWFPGEGKHITIRINNATGNVAYYAGEHTRGQLTSLRMWENALEAAPNGGDRQVLLMTTSTLITSYWDSFRYGTDSDCDRDTDPDSFYLAGDGYVGVFYEPEFDLNENEILDWCEDCNANCLLDSEEIELGVVQDCNSNGIPDECDVDPNLPLEYQYGCTPYGGKNPCTDYGCDWMFYTRQGGGSFDCNANGVPDDCETVLDCNGNGMLDACEIDCSHPACANPPPECGLGFDCNSNGTLDECEDDCNGNLVEDGCDIASGTSEDCQSNGVPDECEEDCDGDGTPDECVIATDPELDCDGNGVPDVCQVVPDCNGNGVHDGCDISGDFDGDGDVGLDDYAEFRACLTTPCPGPPCAPALYAEPCCMLADFDTDGDVDLDDFGGFQIAFTGDL